MKVISIWQPFASLAAKGFKTFETRGWPAPKSIIGQTIGIASTKNIKSEQRLHFDDPDFQVYYSRLGMPPLEELPFGYLIGTVTLDSVELMTEELLEDVSFEEQSYGWWEVGKYAWRLTHPVCFEHPIPIVGKQGIYDWHGDIPGGEKSYQARPTAQMVEGGSGVAEQARPVGDRSHLRLVS